MIECSDFCTLTETVMTSMERETRIAEVSQDMIFSKYFLE